MLSKCLMLASLVCVWSCSDDKRAGGNGGDAGSESAGFAGHAQSGASSAGSGGQAGESAAGRGGLATGGAVTGGAAGIAGGGSNLGGASGAGLGGAGLDAGGASGAGRGGGAAGSDENPYGPCVGEDATDNSCPLPGSVCHADYGCQPPCPSGTVSCAMPPSGGTAKPYCQQRLCRLDCGFGKTCPAGMTCDTASAFCTSNGP
jgi:hypothetical protein